MALFHSIRTRLVFSRAERFCLIIIMAVLILVSFKTCDRPNADSRAEKPFVNVCDWYGILTPDILHDFEAETGIRVQYDVFDNNEVLEAKLLASNSGYDVVFPTATPYVSRQIKVGIYQPIRKEWLSNLKGLNAIIVEKMQLIDPDMHYAIPFYWGTLGIAIDRDKVAALLPGMTFDGYDILFNPDVVAQLKQCGVSFLEEAVDVFPQLQRYLGLDPSMETTESLAAVQAHLTKLRPSIRRFTSARFMNDLIMGDLCVAQAWSGEAHQARNEVKDMNRTIDYIIPKEGTSLWVDCIAIPVGAPHPTNAHKFINFLLRPDIAARITNHTAMPTVIEAARPLIKKEIRYDATIYPPIEVMNRLYMSPPQTSNESLAFDRRRTKVWTTIRLNR